MYLMLKTWSLCTGAKLNLGDKVWVKEKRIPLLLCQAKGDTEDSCPSKLCVPTREDLVRSFMAVVQGWGC